MREAPAGARLLDGVSGLLAVMSLLAGGFVVVSTLLFICENHFVGPVRDFWHIVPLLERFDRGEGTFALLARLHGGDLVLLPSDAGAAFEVRLSTPSPKGEST